MKKYTYPACKTVDVTEDWFGVHLPDPYAWLKEAKSKEVLDFVAAENAYTDDYFDRTALDHKIAQLIDAVAAVHQAGKFFFQFIHFVLVSPFSKYMPILYPF